MHTLGSRRSLKHYSDLGQCRWNQVKNGKHNCFKQPQHQKTVHNFGPIDIPSAFRRSIGAIGLMMASCSQNDFCDHGHKLSQYYLTCIYIYTLEVKPPFFIGWFTKHHYFTRGLSSSKRNPPSTKPWNEMLGHLGQRTHKRFALETGKDIESLLCILFFFVCSCCVFKEINYELFAVLYIFYICVSLFFGSDNKILDIL